MMFALSLNGCGGGGSSSSGSNGPAALSSFELLDPTPGASHQFGTFVIVLTNGKIVVAEPNDGGGGMSGAVHLFDPVTRALVASLFGDNSGDRLGESGVTALTNGNFVINSPSDDVGGVTDAASVILVDGNTGAAIGTPLSGDDINDAFGIDGIVALTNGNYVIVSALDDVGGVDDVGSITLVNGDTGVVIGTPIVGDTLSDALGNSGVTALGNGNYVVASPFDDIGGNQNAGSAILVDGSTGVTIGTPLVGDQPFDNIGLSSITALTNGNYVVASERDQIGGNAGAGSVTLVNGGTGATIDTVVGDSINDFLGRTSVTELSNGNYVIASESDQVGGVTRAGSVALVNGATGMTIGTPLAGDTTDDHLGETSVRALVNGNFVIASAMDDVGGIANAGSVILVDGSTGIIIGTPIAGDFPNDSMGSSNVTALDNGNYVVGSATDSVGGIVNAGSIILVNGATGAIIGTPLTGDNTLDSLGLSGVVALANNNYVVASQNDDVGGISDAGSVALLDGSSGASIGTPLSGDNTDDFFASDGVRPLGNGNYVFASSSDNIGGITDAGSATLVDGNTGMMIGTPLTGDNTNDLIGSTDIIPYDTENYLVVSEMDNVGGFSDAGSVQFIVP